MATKLVLFCIASVAFGQDAPQGARGTSVSMGDDSNMAPRQTITTISDLWEFAKFGEGNNAIFGCFAVDDEGGVIGRNNTKSHYGVFREASVKNKDVPFAIIKDVELIKQVGVDERRLPALITMHLDEEKSLMEFRKSQFFEDNTVYISEDPTRIFAYLKKDGDEYNLKDMRPKMANPNAPKSQPNV